MRRFALLALLAACSSDPAQSVAAEPACVPGRVAACPCATGDGVQTCDDDGGGFGACVCPVAQAGAGGSSGAGGELSAGAGGEAPSAGSGGEAGSTAGAGGDTAGAAGEAGEGGDGGTAGEPGGGGQAGQATAGASGEAGEAGQGGEAGAAGESSKCDLPTKPKCQNYDDPRTNGVFGKWACDEAKGVAFCAIEYAAPIPSSLHVVPCDQAPALTPSLVTSCSGEPLFTGCYVSPESEADQWAARSCARVQLGMKDNDGVAYGAWCCLPVAP